MAARPLQERWLLGLAGALLAVLAVLPPAGYLLVTLRYQAGALEAEAVAIAGELDDLVTANPELWRFEQMRFEEVLARRGGAATAERRSILELGGAPVAHNGVELAPPRLVRSALILDAGVPIARVEVARSARPALAAALLLAVVLAPAAGAAHLLLRGLLRRAAAARAAAEAQLRQAQRLEAVGRLASGVAHDFNNVLAAVLGFSRELRRELPAGSPHLELVDEIVSVAERGAQVTRNLLAFSRQQPLALRLADAGALVRGVERQVRALLSPGQGLRLEVAGGPLPVEVDPAQLEGVLVHLAANGRDAMGPAGTLRLEAGSLELEGGAAAAAGLPPGPYVRVAVHDDGGGMVEETRQLVFDPFFTTKAVGRGAGLGLAVAHGVVQQHRGVIQVTSAPGEGTTFAVLLPRADGAAADARTAVPPYSVSSRTRS